MRILGCVGQAIVSVSCGTDFCADSGSEMGGGACSATDYYCAAGACGATATGGTDTCGGTVDAPSVTNSGTSEIP